MRTSRCLAARLLAALLTTAAATPLLFGAEPSHERSFAVRLKPVQLADETRAVAEELAKLYGGRLAEERGGGQSFVMLLTDSRARLVAADPRVQAVVPLTPVVEAAAAEVVPWSSGVAYTYDGSGNVRQIGKDTFTYDHVDRLIQADVNGIRRNYGYDEYGNRKQCTQGAGTPAQADCQGYSINSLDNHIAEALYDPAGAGTVTTLGAHSYVYDEFLMLKRDQSADPREFIYTADDERVAVYYPNSRSWRWTVRDISNKVLRELASDGGAYGTASFRWTKDFVWRDNLLLASRQPEGSVTSTYHYHLDHLGTPRRITDSNDNPAGFHDYFAFGPEVNGGKDEPSLTALKYTGHERDRASDPFGVLDYMHARYYNPELGRFLSLDPKLGKPELPQSWNRYTYAYDNPLRAFDPDGRETLDYKILHVRVNLVYSNSDFKGMWVPSTLRERVEAGTILTRQLYAHVGIAFSFHRYEGRGIDLSTYNFKDPNLKLLGTVKTEQGEVSVNDFMKDNLGKALTVFVAGDISLGTSSHGGTGFSHGTPAFTIIPRDASSGTLPHEIAHALGNTIGDTSKPAPGANEVTDFIWFMERQQYNLGIGFSLTFENWLREGAESLDCFWNEDC